MDIDFNDLSEEQQKVLLNIGKFRGYSREKIIDRFNDAASDSDNALDFFDNDEFIEDTLRKDRSVLEDYLDYIIDRI